MDRWHSIERFDINFAIRLALSRVLSWNANAQLRTLVIDEGFGSQDASGLENLIQAIGEVQNEFDCILVITHIEELKERFEHKIEVVKTSTGSAVTMT